MSFDPQDARKDGVEGAHPKILSFGAAEELLNSALHFARCLIGKRECQNVERIHALLHEVGDSKGQYAGLARTCTRNNHDRTIGLFHGFLLDRIKGR